MITIVGRAATWFLAIATSLVLLMIPAPALAGSGDCVSVDVPAPIVMPNGAQHPAGELTLCNWRVFSPVANVHKSYVNGQPVNLLMAQRRSSEGGGRIPSEVVFRRAAGGSLELLGYVRSSGGRSTTFTFQPGRKQSRRIELDRHPARDEPDNLVVMARPH